MIRWTTALALVLSAALPLAAEGAGEGPGFAVVELFTSEGCSSCPPADSALSQLAHDAAGSGLPVYALEWHVDYWDYLGWKDPWDSSAATQRQYAYARSLPSSVYTPQAVINGQTVPSYAGDLKELETDARQAASRPAAARVTLDDVREAAPGELRGHVEVSTVPGGDVLLLVETEGDLGATPRAGENAGRSLVHSSVVRAWKIIPAATGDFTMQIPTAGRAPRRRLVAIVQDPRTMHILAASRTDLGQAAAGQLSGRVVNADGQPLAGVLIQACSARLCIPARTDRAGCFSMAEVPAGSYEMDLSLDGPAGARLQILDHPADIVVARTVWRVTQGSARTLAR